MNIVLYNVLGGPGPDLYGTEPWSFYVKNLLLNFNVAAVLAIFGLPLSVIIYCKSFAVANGDRKFLIFCKFFFCFFLNLW